ncbi:MAG: hypothetical protein N2A42_01285 [Luteolibacter sp.]
MTTQEYNKSPEGTVSETEPEGNHPPGSKADRPNIGMTLREN